MLIHTVKLLLLSRRCVSSCMCITMTQSLIAILQIVEIEDRDIQNDGRHIIRIGITCVGLAQLSCKGYLTLLMLSRSPRIYQNLQSQK